MDDQDERDLSDSEDEDAVRIAIPTAATNEPVVSFGPDEREALRAKQQPRKESRPISIIEDGESEATPLAKPHHTTHEPPEPPIVVARKRAPAFAFSNLMRKKAPVVAPTRKQQQEIYTHPQAQAQEEEEEEEQEQEEQEQEHKHPQQKPKTAVPKPRPPTPIPSKATLPQFAPPTRRSTQQPMQPHVKGPTTQEKKFAPSPAVVKQAAGRSFHVPLERHSVQESETTLVVPPKERAYYEEDPETPPEPEIFEPEPMPASDPDGDMLAWMDRVIADVPSEWHECLTELRGYFHLSVEMIKEILKFNAILENHAHLYNDNDRRFVQNKHDCIADARRDSSQVFITLFTSITTAIIPLRTLINERRSNLEDADLHSKVFEHTDVHAYFLDEQKNIGNQYLDVLEKYQVQMRADIDRIRSKFAALRYKPNK